MSRLQPQSATIFVRHAAWLLLGLALGAWFGNAFAGLAIAAIAALFWHLRRLRHLLEWSRKPTDDLLPFDDGPWGAIYSNIHHLRSVADRLKSRQRQLLLQWRDVTNALPDAGILLNDQFQIVEYNEAAKRLLGLHKEHGTGLHITNLLRHPNLVKYFDEGRFDRSVRIDAGADAAHPYLCHAIPYAQGQYLLIVRDITKREHADRIKADFVANASHELRTPLTVLHGYLMSMSEDGDLPKYWRDPVKAMHSQVERMRSLVDGLLRLNALEVQTDAPYTPVPVASILAEACGDAGRLGNGQKQISLSQDDSLALLGDASAFQSIVTNLLSNAVRFTPDGGRIDVRWWRENGAAHLSVADTGIGIAPQDLARVTERFYRTDPGRARDDGGTGLGLAIVKHALSAHQAHLEVHSDGEHGSTFVCHFPSARSVVTHEGH